MRGLMAAAVHLTLGLLGSHGWRRKATRCCLPVLMAWPWETQCRLLRPLHASGPWHGLSR